MGDITLRPRSIVEILDASFALFRRDYLKYVSIMAVVSLPYQIVMLFWNRSYLSTLLNSSAAAYEDVSMLMSMVAVPLIATVFWYPIVDAAIMSAASDGYHGRDVSIGGSFSHLARRLPPLLAAVILRGLVLIATFMILVIPGIYFFILLFCVVPAIMLERVSVTGAFSRSTSLTEGSKWKIFFAIVLIYIIVQALKLLAGLVSIFTSNLMVAQIFASVAEIFLYPVMPISMTVLYYDMRIRREGYDIELMSRELGDTAAPPPAH